ncbi:MAG: endonuclease/exonuclease/phosphatase family protein [Bryobacterales bacterium]|nr:endonuclease/exonuclease/phosphatase family protein [Bryobacterales bacterium]
MATGQAKWEASGLPGASELGLLNALPTRVCRAKVAGVYYAGSTTTTIPASCQIASPAGFATAANYEQLYDFVSTGDFVIRNQELCLTARSGQFPLVQLRTCANNLGDQWRLQAVTGGQVRLESVGQIGQCLHRDASTNAATLAPCASASPLRQSPFTDTTFRFFDHGSNLILGRGEGLTSKVPLSFRSSSGTPAEGFEVLTPNEASRRFSVTTYNIMMLPIVVFPRLQQMSRADMIPDALDRLGLLADVLTFQEGFQNESRTAMLSRLNSQYGYSFFTGVPDHTPQAYELLGLLSSFATNGGMFIASRWPIEKIAFHKFVSKSDDGFADTTGLDAFAAKGVTYARILKMGRRYHVFTTHLQAGPPWDEAAIRQAQLREMKTFADGQLSEASPDDGVIFSGDFNIDMELDVGNYYYLTDALQCDFVEAPRPIGISFGAGRMWTVDPLQNDISNKRGASFEWLDYSFIARRGARVTRASYQVHQPENSFPYLMEIKNTGELAWTQDPFFTKDVSDHGALFASYIFAPAANVVAPADLVNVEFRTRFQSDSFEGQVRIGGGTVATPQTVVMERNKAVELEALPSLPAMPGYRYAFDRWENGGARMFSFTPTVNDRLNILYRRQLEVAATVNPPEAGTVSGAGFYYEDTPAVTLTAGAKPGFTFQGFGPPFNSTTSTLQIRELRGPIQVAANFASIGTPRLSLLPAGPRVYSSDNSTVRVPLRMSNNGPGGAINARIVAVRNIAVTSGTGAVQIAGEIPGFGTIPAGAVSTTASDVPFLWPASALRIRAEFVLASDGGYTTAVVLNLNR